MVLKKLFEYPIKLIVLPVRGAAHGQDRVQVPVVPVLAKVRCVCNKAFSQYNKPVRIVAAVVKQLLTHVILVAEKALFEKKKLYP